MTVIVLLGAPGAGKGTQAPALAARLGVPVLASGDLLRAAVAQRTALGREADRYMSRGQLVPDETIVRVFLDRLEAARRRRRRDPRRLPADAGSRPRRSTTRSRTPGRRVDRAGYIDVPLEDLVMRMANRRICTANGHVYNLVSNPPRVDGVCDLDGSELVQRGDDEPRRPSGRGWPSRCRRCSRSSSTTARAASSPRSTAGWAIDAVTDALMTAFADVGAV